MVLMSFWQIVSFFVSWLYFVTETLLQCSSDANNGHMRRHGCANLDGVA